MEYRIGAVQPLDIQNDVPAAVATVARYMAEADRQGIALLCFPECFLQGYTLDAAETKRRALSVGSQAMKDVLAQLAPYNTTAVLGLIEEDNGSYFNTAAVIKNGAIIGKYRKVNLFETNFQAGTDYPVFTIGGLTFGINICYDARFQEGAAALAEQGAKVILYPLSNRWPIPKAKKYRYKHVPNLVDRAMESGCWVVSSDVVHQDDETIAFGCAAVVSPEGDVVTRLPELKTGMTGFTLEIQGQPYLAR